MAKLILGIKAFVGLALAVALVSVGTTYIFLRQHPTQKIAASKASATEDDLAGTATSKEPLPVHLYFGGRSGNFLIAEQHMIGYFADANRLGRALLAALIGGPKSRDSGLAPTLPVQTQVLGFFITADRTAYVDFDRTVSEHYPGGAYSELLSIYSVVNTLVLNCDQIDRVKFLIQGSDAPTLAGHVDTLEPFKANMLLVR